MSTHPWKVSNVAGVAEPCAIPGSGRDLLREPLFLAQVYSVSSVVFSAQSACKSKWDGRPACGPSCPRCLWPGGVLFWVFQFLGQKLCISHLVLKTIFRGGERTIPGVMWAAFLLFTHSTQPGTVETVSVDLVWAWESDQGFRLTLRGVFQSRVW